MAYKYPEGSIGRLYEEAGVDKTHLRGHKPIKSFHCVKCGTDIKVGKNDWHSVESEGTLGTCVVCAKVIIDG